MNPDLWYPLPPDMNAWNTAITETMSRKMPEIPQYITSITWSRLDPATGDGDGLVELLGGIASAPITIRQNKLAPIDIIAAKSSSGDIKFYPLSPLFIQKLYANNVVAEPVDNMANRDESYEGPGKRVQHIKTVDSVKYASIESANALLNEITKSASVANWVAENMPDTLLAIYNRANDTDLYKTASLLDDMPELIIISKEGDNYYTNGELVPFEKVASFCKTFDIPLENREAMMNGVPLVVDNREKLASIHIPTDQDITMDRDIEDELFSSDSHEGIENKVPYVALTKAYLRDGTEKQGIVFSQGSIENSYGSRTQEGYTVPAHRATHVTNVDIDPADSCRVTNRELFICDSGYGFNSTIKTSVRTPITTRFLINSSTEDEPVAGAVGIFMTESRVVDFGRVESVWLSGRLKKVTLYSYISHAQQIVDVSAHTRFYLVKDNILPVVNAGQITDTITMGGINGTVSLDNEGNVIIDGIKESVVNCPYALMSKYAMAYDDACDVISVAMDRGRCVFTAYESLDKTAEAYNDNPDKTKDNKQPRKGTATGSDDDANAGQGQDGIAGSDVFSLSPTTPEAAMSGPVQNSQANVGAGQVPNTQAGMGVNQPTGFGTAAVNANDMENVVNLNSQPVMDAYMMANLASTNLSNKETLLRASDTILNALSQLSQLLFLVRQGQLDFISEADVQVSMNKLTDVAQSLGISTTQVAP